MRAKFPQPDGRGIVPRKWSVVKDCGPLVLVCEKVLKKLIQHGWPAFYQVQPTNRLHPVAVLWFNELGETVEFLDALERAITIVAGGYRVTVHLTANRVTLVGEWVVRLRIVGGRTAAASIHPAPECPF